MLGLIGYRFALSLGDEVVCIVTREGNKRSEVDFDDSIAHPVEKVPIMGHKNAGPLIAGEEFLEPEDGVCIEMVGGLVENQEVGARDKAATKGDPSFFAAQGRSDL
jgi:hypothetical protein